LINFDPSDSLAVLLVVSRFLAKLAIVAADASVSELSISLGGRLLLASPSLTDGTFDRSVIILAEHSAKEGALGVIINHRTDTRVGDLLKDAEFAPLRELPIYQGGPLSTSELTFSSFSWSNKSGLDYQIRIPADVAADLMKNNKHIVHATLGHSAWAPGQLEDELQRNTWIPAKPAKNLLTTPHDITLWQDLMKNISPYHHLLATAPKNPFLN